MTHHTHEHLQDTHKETFARRTLRLLAVRRNAYHQRWFRLCASGLLPLAPLAATPLPNLPVYYVGYRVYSHHNARKGAETVLHALARRDAAARQRLRAAVSDMQRAGHSPAAGSWSALLLEGPAAAGAETGASGSGGVAAASASTSQPEVGAYAAGLAPEIAFERSAALTQACARESGCAFLRSRCGLAVLS